MTDTYTVEWRRGTASAWTSANTVLAAGEPGYETDTGRLKIGDGSTAWTSLAYVIPTPSGQESIDVLATAKSNVSWSTVAQSSTAYNGGTLASAGAQNNEVVFSKYLQGGSYTIDLLYANWPTHGIAAIFIDGTQVTTTVDMYAASGGVARSSVMNVAVVGDKAHDIKIKMIDKNASTTTPFYLGTLMGIGLTRTGS